MRNAFGYLLRKESADCGVFNTGTSNGYTVLELINEFEKASGVNTQLPVKTRRPGDVVAIYANNDRARQLCWDGIQIQSSRNDGYCPGNGSCV